MQVLKLAALIAAMGVSLLAQAQKEDVADLLAQAQEENETDWKLACALTRLHVEIVRLKIMDTHILELVCAEGECGSGVLADINKSQAERQQNLEKVETFKNSVCALVGDNDSD
ncbi:MAG: hypothetical protein OXF23_00575 [Candidatus Dadabacteria bacterium]|nr:hypothetical protein [Candidatus Dadabacteria bacterium]